MAQSKFNVARGALWQARFRTGEGMRVSPAPRFERIQKHNARGIGAFACAALLLAASPAFAQSGGGADPTSIVQAIVDIITGTLGKIIAVAAICVVGIGAMLGAFSARVAGGVILGVILIFSASWIVDQLLGGV